MFARITCISLILAGALAGALAGNVGANQESWSSAFNAGRQHYDNGRYADAEKAFERAAELASANSRDQADSWNWLGLSRWKLAKYPDAEAAHLKARPLYLKLNGEKSAPYAFSTNNLGLVYWHQGRLKEGDELLHQALKILEQVEGDKGINLARGFNNTGGLYRSRGFWKKSEPMLLRSVAIWEARGFPHGDAAHAYSNLGRLREKQGKLPEAVELFQKGLDVSKKKLPAGHPQIGEFSCYLGDALRIQGKLEAADKLLAEGMKLLEKKLPQDHSARANALNYLGDLRSAQGKKEEARQLFEQSVASWAKQSVPPLGAAEAHLRFAILCVDTGKTDNARKHFDAALAIYEKTAGLTSPDMAATLEAYAKLLQSTDAEQAAKLRERAAEARRRHVEENR